MRSSLRAVVVCLLFASVAHGEGVEELLERYAEARGGLARWRAASALTLTGTYVSFSQEAPFTLRRQRPGLYFFETASLAGRMVRGVDDHGPWWIEPLYGYTWAWRAPEPDAGYISRAAAFEPPLLDALAKGFAVDSLGPGEVDGQETLRLQLTLPGERVEIWHLDPRTGLEVAIDSRFIDLSTGPQEHELRTFFDDFRSVDGLMIPHHVEREYGPRHVMMLIERAEVDQTVAADSFRMPLPDGMEKLRSLVGRWDLTIARRDSPRSPWEETKTTSSIVPLFEGAVLEERFAYEASGAKTEVIRRRSYDHFSGVYRFTHVDNFTLHLDIFAGALADGDRIIVDNLASGTAPRFDGTPYFERQTIHAITPDGFKLDVEQSSDGGETWALLSRYTYTRLVDS